VNLFGFVCIQTDEVRTSYVHHVKVSSLHLLLQTAQTYAFFTKHLSSQVNQRKASSSTILKTHKTCYQQN